MSTKLQPKKRKAVSRQKSTPDEDEIVEIEEIPSRKTSRKYPKKKENTENSSSEATTPNKKNKKKQNKKKKDTDLIEIMDIEIPDDESLSITKKSSIPVPKTKKSINRNNTKDKEKGLSVMSVSKISSKEKSPIIKAKKNKKIASITLDESENEKENEIKVTTEVKISPSNKKSTSKTPGKKSINKSRDNTNVLEKKNKKNEKKNNKKKEEEIIQCELSSDSENEKKKIIISRLQKKKKINKSEDLCRKPSDKFNSGYLSSRKISQRKQRNNINEELKSKSTIKVSIKDDSLKTKMNNLLGRKRKSDNRNQKSQTPNKKSNKSDSPNKKNRNRKIPSQIKVGNQKSKTPLRTYPKNNKNNNNNDLLNPKMDIEEKHSHKSYATPELAVLNQLISEYGFERVLDSLCKSKLEQKNKLDSCLQGLKNSCSNEKLPFLLIKMLFSYFDSKFDGNKIISDKKRSISAIKSNNLKNISEKSKIDKLDSKRPITQNNSNYSVMDQCENENPIEIRDEDVQETKENNKNNSMDDNNNKDVKSNAKEEEKKGEKKMMSIGSHYNKAEDDKIYKYQVASLDGKGNAIFKCYDDKCNGMGIYNLETKKFSITKKHNLSHAEHDYIINYEKDGDNVFKDLTDTGKSDAQVFKENGERTVKIY